MLSCAPRGLLLWRVAGGRGGVLVHFTAQLCTLYCRSIGCVSGIAQKDGRRAGRSPAAITGHVAPIPRHNAKAIALVPLETGRCPKAPGSVTTTLPLPASADPEDEGCTADFSNIQAGTACRILD